MRYYSLITIDFALPPQTSPIYLLFVSLVNFCTPRCYNSPHVIVISSLSLFLSCLSGYLIFPTLFPLSHSRHAGTSFKSSACTLEKIINARKWQLSTCGNSRFQMENNSGSLKKISLVTENFYHPKKGGWGAALCFQQKLGLANKERHHSVLLSWLLLSNEK